MNDIYRNFTNNLILKLGLALLPAESYLRILLFILSNYRFGIKFLKKINDLIDDEKNR